MKAARMVWRLIIVNMEKAFFDPDVLFCNDG